MIVIGPKLSLYAWKIILAEYDNKIVLWSEYIRKRVYDSIWFCVLIIDSERMKPA